MENAYMGSVSPLITKELRKKQLLELAEKLSIYIDRDYNRTMYYDMLDLLLNDNETYIKVAFNAHLGKKTLIHWYDISIHMVKYYDETIT